MKNIPLAIIALVLVASICGCDIITSPYRENIPPPDTNTVDTTKPIQKVLLIDYTGYRCGNCPKGAEAAAALHETFGEKLIIIAMHTGKTFAEPDDSPEFTVDFRTPAGEQLYNDLGKPGQPTGTINYAPVSGKRDVAYAGWGTEVQKQLLLTPQMSIKLTPQLSSDSVLTLKADVKYVTAGSGQRIVAYLVEDSIINAQEDYRLKTKPQIIPNFVQRHVFRGTIGAGDAFGEAIAATASGSTVTKNYTFDFKGKGFNTRHCSVIVAINDITSKNTIQVEEVSITK